MDRRDGPSIVVQVFVGASPDRRTLDQIQRAAGGVLPRGSASVFGAHDPEEGFTPSDEQRLTVINVSGPIDRRSQEQIAKASYDRPLKEQARHA